MGSIKGDPMAHLQAWAVANEHARSGWECRSRIYSHDACSIALHTSFADPGRPRHETREAWSRKLSRKWSRDLDAGIISQGDGAACGEDARGVREGSSEEEALREKAKRRKRRRGEGRKERSGRRKRATAEPGPMRIIAASGGRAAEAPGTVIGREEENRTDKTSGGRSVGIRCRYTASGCFSFP